jgi:hypothetical protein
VKTCSKCAYFWIDDTPVPEPQPGYKANLRILDVEDIKAVPYTLMSHPFVERLIGILRREFFDNVFLYP